MEQLRERDLKSLMKALSAEEREIKEMVRAEYGGSPLHRFEILDDVFHAFLETNMRQGAHMTLEQILTTTLTQGRRFLRYEHASIPYLATLYLYQGPDADWVCVKLCNNGFWYMKRPGETFARHHSSGWISLPDCFSQFKHTKAALPASYSRLAVFYNFNVQRLDIKLYSDDTSKAPNLLITYEPGVPYDDDRIQPVPFRT